MQKVVIIGAGPAGLTAAHELLTKSKDVQVTILEEDKAVGGISKTINYKGNRMDLGGHRFFTKEKRVQDFWNKIMKDDMLEVKRVSRIYYLRKFFDYPISLKFETIKNLGFIRTINAGFSYLKASIFKRKEKNLEDFYINRFGYKLYSMFFESYTEKVWGRHPSEISSSWGAQRVKGISIKAVLVDSFKRLFKIENNKKEASLIEKFQYPKYGPGELWDRVASEVEFMGATLLKESKVVKITKKSNKLSKVTYESKDKEHTINADIVISSMPIKDLINAMEVEDEKVKDVANNLPYRDFKTIGILAKKLKLKNIPDCWIYIQDEDTVVGRIQIFNNWSSYLVKEKKTKWISLEYFCNEGDDIWSMSDKKFMELASEELKKIDFIDKKDILDYKVVKVKKAYPAYFDSYSEFDIVKGYLNKYENLYCIGRNGQHRYNNMDHSMMCAFIAADCILNEGKEKNKIWDVNTEGEYHEIKKN